MGKTKKNYISFMAGMATMVLLACLISASLAEEEAPAAQPQAESQVRVQAGDLRLACGEAGVALFGVERVAPGEKLKAENGAEIPAVLTYTDEKGEVHHYVEAGMIGDILDVAVGVTYHEDINCVDFGAKPFVNDKGEIGVKANGEPVWLTGDVKCDIDYYTRQEGEAHRNRQVNKRQRRPVPHGGGAGGGRQESGGAQAVNASETGVRRHLRHVHGGGPGGGGSGQLVRHRHEGPGVPEPKEQRGRQRNHRAEL